LIDFVQKYVKIESNQNKSLKHSNREKYVIKRKQIMEAYSIPFLAIRQAHPENSTFFKSSLQWLVIDERNWKLPFDWLKGKTRFSCLQSHFPLYSALNLRRIYTTGKRDSKLLWGGRGRTAFYCPCIRCSPCFYSDPFFRFKTTVQTLLLL